MKNMTMFFHEKTCRFVELALIDRVFGCGVYTLEILDLEVWSKRIGVCAGLHQLEEGFLSLT